MTTNEQRLPYCSKQLSMLVQADIFTHPPLKLVQVSLTESFRENVASVVYDF